MKYWAFLSYSHVDKKWGDWLHKALETYRTPRRLVAKKSRDGTIPERVYPIFRDREELPVSADLNSNINEALRESRYLIVICSPRSAQSRWVGEEIKTFKRLGREDRILALIVDGEPNASEGKPGFKVEDECFHEAMRYRIVEGEQTEIRTEPIAGDAREGKDGKNNAKLKLLAGLLGVNFDDLKQREQERRIRRLRTVIAVALLLLSGFAAVSVYAWLQKQAAQIAQTRAEVEKVRAESALTETRKTLSRSDFLQGQRWTTEDKDYDALPQFARSLSLDPENFSTLARLTNLLTYRSFAFPLYQVKQKGHVVARFSPDSKRIVAASSRDDSFEGEMRILDGDNGKALVDPITNIGVVYIIEFSPDGQRALTASRVGKDAAVTHQVRIWDVQSGRALGVPLEIGAAPIKTARYSLNGKRIVTESSIRSQPNDGRVWTDENELREERLWNPETGKPLCQPLAYYTDNLAAIEISPNGQYFLRVEPDRQSVSVLHVETVKALVSAIKPGGSVTCAHFSPDGEKLLIAVDSKTHLVRLWDARTGQPLTEALGHDDPVQDASFSLDGKRIVTRTWRNVLRVWDAENGKPLSVPHPEFPGYFLRNVEAQFSRNGRRIMTRSQEGMRVWNFEREEADRAFADSYDRIRDAQFSDDGDRVITVSPGAARIWQAATGQPLSERIRGSGIESGQFSPNGKAIMLLSDDGTVTVCDARKGIPMTEPIKLDSSPTTSHSIDGDPIYEDVSCFPKLSPDGKLIAASWDDKQVQVREADTLDLVFKPIQHAESVSFVQFSPDSSRIVTSSKNTVQVWESRTGKALTGPMTHSARVGSVQFTPDGERIITTLADGPAQVWNARTGEPITGGAQSDESIALIRLSHDGKRSVTVSKENAVTVWDIEPRHMVSSPIQFPGKIEVVEFSPDGQRLVIASNETAQVWEVASGKPIGEPMKPGAKVSSAEFSPDGRKVVTASETETAIIWDALTGKQLTPVMKISGRGLASFSPNGKLIVTGMCASCGLEMWDATTGLLVSEPLPHGKGYSRILDVQFSSDSQQILATERNRTARVHDLVPTGRGPQWLLQLADTLAGKHLDDRDIFHPLGNESLELLNQVKGEVNRAPFDDGWARWGRWFLADRSVRTISPFSKVTVLQYIENRIKENTTESLDEAEQLAFGNPDLAQRIAHAKESLSGRK